jgi:signal transduction histidine kinase
MLDDARGQYQELERRREVAEGLRGILAVLNSNRSLDAILDYITACAKNLLHADAVGIYRLEPERRFLTIQSSRGLSDEYLAVATIPLGQSATGRAVLEGAPVTINNVQEEALNVSTYLRPDIAKLLQILSKQYGAVLSVPLVIKQEIVGALTLYYANSRVFDREEIDLAVSFCDQAALAIENARLREKIQEEAVAAERNRIARDLHDSVTQTIFSASLIAEVLPTVWARDPDEGEHGLAELRQLTRGALAEMRTLLLELRPVGLAEAKLEDLLKQLAEGLAGRIRVPVDVHVEGQADLPPDIKISFYRIAQEAINNLAKHSGATQVEMDLKSLPTTKQGRKKAAGYSKKVSMTIRDNGSGFDISAVSSEHMGLSIMRERALTANAALSVHSRPGNGTLILLTWPQQEENNGEI